jgi:hypothetical protein
MRQVYEGKVSAFIEKKAGLAIKLAMGSAKGLYGLRS